GDPDPDGDGFDDEGYPVAPYGLPEERNPNGNAGGGGGGSLNSIITTDLINIEYVWSPTYIDAMIVRDRDTDADSSDSPAERLYVQHDANFNVTALIKTNGDIAERYIYDPYGKASVLW